MHRICTHCQVSSIGTLDSWCRASGNFLSFRLFWKLPSSSSITPSHNLLINVFTLSQAATASPNGASIRCTKLHGPGVVILGDAAHGVTPALGQVRPSSVAQIQFNIEVK